MSEQIATSAARLERAPGLPLWVHGTTVGARRQRDATWALMRASSDALALAAAGALVESATSTLGPGWHAATLLACLAAFAATGTYLPRMRVALTDELRRVLSASALVFAGVGAIVVLGTDRIGAGDSLLIHWLVAATLLCGGRLGVSGARRFSQSRWETGGRTLVVGAGQVGHLTAKRLLDEPAIGLRPVGFLDKDPLLDEHARRLQGFPEIPVMGASWDLERVVAEQGIDNVVVAFSTAPHHVMLDIVRRCWKLGVGVLVVPRLYEVEGRRMQVEHLGALPLVRLHTSDPSGWQMSVKYLLDRAVAALALLGLAPLMAVLALAVLVSTGRPVLFRQRRVGRDGHAFDMLKFRTMRGAPVENGEADAAWASLIVDGAADEPGAAADGDRRTPVGALLRKLSLDELPQLWNVVRGDMSLVGPRPERVHYVERFENVVYRYPDRHRVKSGLTGWAQVNGLRGETSLGDRIEWDNFYIENWSPWLDLKILVRTIPALIGRGGS
jgi:exopolysaccharide biosynthesis polyprenyl glycosylphosphotransferase